VREVLGVDASREVREATARAERLRQPVTTIRRLAVFSVRGGAGKTTVATLLATTLAAARHDRVLAADATPGLGPLAPEPAAPDLGAVPGLGSLALRARGSSTATIQEVAGAAGRLRSFADAEPRLSRGDGGLWLLTGDGGRLDLPAYQAAVAALSRFFAVLVTDCGPDPGGDLNLAVLLDAHALALVTPATVDGLVGAHQALAWLRQTPAAALVSRTVVVLATQTPHTDGVDLKRGTRTLASRGVRVARLPYHRHLAAGARIHPDLLGERTRDMAMALAADLLSFAVSDRGGW
jgi:MinD-like ATPase involved in chromosome partitioning or flagellar assembly